MAQILLCTRIYFNGNKTGHEKSESKTVINDSERIEIVVLRDDKQLNLSSKYYLSYSMILEVDESGHTNMSTSIYSHHFNNLIIKRRRGKWLQQIYNIGKITAVHRDKKGSIGPALCLDKMCTVLSKTPTLRY